MKRLTEAWSREHIVPDSSESPMAVVLELWATVQITV